MKIHRLVHRGSGLVAGLLLAACGRQITDGASGQTVADVSTNLILNPSFESDLSTWAGWNADLQRVKLSGAPNGAYVALVTQRAGTSFSIDDRPGASISAPAGATFTTSGWVRAASTSSVGKPVTLAARELDGSGQTVNAWSTSGTLTNQFQQLTARGANPASGHTLDVYLLQASAGAGDAFYADEVSLTQDAPTGSLVVYGAPAGALTNPAFTVQVRNPGGPWQQPASYDTRVNRVAPSHASFASFDFTGSVDVRVTYNGGVISSARIRPLSYNIVPTVAGNVLSFTLNQPRNLSIEVNGDIYGNLHLFANPPETAPPDCTAPGTVCFLPGFHTYQNDPRLKVVGHTSDGRPEVSFQAGSGTTVYVAGGAVVRSKLDFQGASNLIVRGRGVMDLSLYDNPNGDPGGWDTSAVVLSHGSNIQIEGLVWHSAPGYTFEGGQVSGVTLTNVKAFSSREWGDGVDMMSSSNVTVDGAFLRTSDDSIAIYGSRYGYLGGSTGWTVANSTLWADKAHPIFIGVHGDFAQNGDTLSDLTFRNIDILEANELSSGYWGALSIGCGDKNTVSNVLFDGIRVENIRNPGRLIDIQFKTFGSGVLGDHIDNVTFRNVSYGGPDPSLIAGESATRTITGITFENLMLGAHRACDAKSANLTLNSYVSQVQFTGPNGGSCVP